MSETQSDVESVRMLGLAPIPVGHRVEVRWFRKKRSLFLGAAEYVEKPFQPLIMDVETQITYGTEWHYVDGALRHLDVNVQVPDVRSPLEMQRLLRGTVLACTVVNVVHVPQIETHLIVRRSTSGAPFR